MSSLLVTLRPYGKLIVCLAGLVVLAVVLFNLKNGSSSAPSLLRWKIAAGLAVLAAVSGALLDLATDAFYARVYAWFPDGRVVNLSPSARGKFYEPHVHPLGKDVIFFGNETGAPQLWKTDLSTGQSAPLTPPSFSARHPAYSWDGTQIAYVSDEGTGQPPERVEEMGKEGIPPRNHIFHIHIMNADGSGRRPLTSGSFLDQRPFFSPDRKTVVFVSTRGGDTRIWSVPADGSGAPVALQTSGNGYRPCFSVDGRTIYFFSFFGEQHRICRMPAEGGSFEPLANDTIGKSHGPFALPDGKSILLHSYSAGAYSLWELPLDGSPPRKTPPPGFPFATHATRSQNGVTAFDIAEYESALRRMVIYARWKIQGWRGNKPAK